MPLPEKPSIAVLPFKNVSADPEQDYFADGITEDITTALARMRWLFVIARNSAFTYKGLQFDMREVGEKLGVRYLLEGSVRRATNRLRITGQLVEAETGIQIWTDRFDGSVEDVFTLQDQVTEAVAAAIEPELRRAEIARARRKTPESLTSYDLYLRALACFWSGKHEEIAETLRLLSEVMRNEPSYAPPYALAAQCHRYNIVQGWSDDVAGDREAGAKLAYAALDRDRDDPTVLWMAGHAIVGFTSDRETGLTCLAKAIKLNPNSSSAWCFSGWAHLFADDWTTALDHIQVTFRLSPLDRSIHIFQSGLALAFNLGERYGEAVLWAKASVLEQPSWTTGHRVLVSSLAHLGRTTKAQEAAQVLLHHEPNYHLAQGLALAPNAGPAWRKYLEGLRLAGLPE